MSCVGVAFCLEPMRHLVFATECRLGTCENLDYNP